MLFEWKIALCSHPFRRRDFFELLSAQIHNDACLRLWKLIRQPNVGNKDVCSSGTHIRNQHCNCFFRFLRTVHIPNSFKWYCRSNTLHNSTIGISFASLVRRYTNNYGRAITKRKYHTFRCVKTKTETKIKISKSREGARTLIRIACAHQDRAVRSETAVSSWCDYYVMNNASYIMATANTCPNSFIYTHIGTGTRWRR